MRPFLTILLLLSCWIAISTGCKKVYAPPAIQVDNRFLVIDGVLLNSPDSPSTFILSRTTRLSDSSTVSSAEAGAQVTVESNAGEHVDFTEQAGGIYKANTVSLNTANQYRLKIITAAGSQYLSDYVTVKQTPPIDSLNWKQQNDVTVYASTHDPLNSTNYYRWDFVETWQYTSNINSELGVKNGVIFFTDSTNQQYNCWSTANSSKIILASSIALSADVISQAPITVISQNDSRIGIRYSILVKQYALTEQGYQYFEILNKNTENLGSIFDAQPSQLTGNIHSVSNPAEVVIGFFSASSVQQKRIFISNNEVKDWNPVNTDRSCDSMNIQQNTTNYLLYDYADQAFGPYHFVSPDVLAIARKSCLDCTLKGGTNIKPLFW